MWETGGFPGFRKPPLRRYCTRARGTTGRARFFPAKCLLDVILPACHRSLTSTPRVPAPHRLANTDVEDFYSQSDPDKENLCLYGNPDGTWEVQLPAEEVPPELPEPALGINFARDGMQVRFPDRRAKDFRSLFTLLSRIFPPRARRLTPRSRSELAEEGLARARRGALRRVADGGGVLLRRQVRREGAVRFPGRILRASTRNSSRGSRFAKTTLIQHRESRSPSPPCSRAQGETLQAHQRASHGVRDPLWQGDRQAQGEQKAPRRGAGTPRSPTRLSRKAVACRVSRIPLCRRCA